MQYMMLQSNKNMMNNPQKMQMPDLNQEEITKQALRERFMQNFTQSQMQNAAAAGGIA